MIITIDVGNTNITVGVFDGDEVAATFRITTKMPRTSDEYGMLLINLLEQNDIKHEEIVDGSGSFQEWYQSTEKCLSETRRHWKRYGCSGQSTRQFMAIPVGVTRNGSAGLMVLMPTVSSNIFSMPVRQQVPPQR